MRAWWIGGLVLTGCSFSIDLVPEDADVQDPDARRDGSPDTPDMAIPGRISTNLIAFYNFAEGSGLVVTDTAGVPGPQDLVIVNPASFTWGPSSLTVNAPGDIASPVGAYRLIQSAKASDQITLEAWVTPANTSQTAMTAGQPARIATLTVRNAGQHLLGLGQDMGTWVGQVRTDALGLDGHGGSPTLRNGAVAITATHLVVTSTPTARHFYVNGVAVSDDKGGLLDAWKDTFVLELAGDPVQRNTWLGAMHLIAIYDVALDETQVMTNFQAGM